MTAAGSSTQQEKNDAPSWPDQQVHESWALPFDLY